MRRNGCVGSSSAQQMQPRPSAAAMRQQRSGEHHRTMMHTQDTGLASF